MTIPFLCGLMAAGLLFGAQAHTDQLAPQMAEGASLAGVDANANGIRDDVEALISKWALDDAKSHALGQMALAMQRALVVDVDNEAQRVAVVHALGAGVACLRATYPHGESTHWLHAIEEATANTTARKAAYARFNRAANGKVLRLPKNLGCAR